MQGEEENADYQQFFLSPTFVKRLDCVVKSYQDELESHLFL